MLLGKNIRDFLLDGVQPSFRHVHISHPSVYTFADSDASEYEDESIIKCERTPTLAK